MLASRSIADGEIMAAHSIVATTNAQSLLASQANPPKKRKSMKRYFLLLASLIVVSLCCRAVSSASENHTVVLFETTEGNIKIALSNLTPLHRDNFIRLVKAHFYDSLLFHRVIPNFMIQAGDPKSKHAEPGQMLGSGTLEYELPAEIHLPELFHKRGAVAMARESDEVNPEHKSSSCQFYIVWGRTFSTADVEKQRQRLAALPNGGVEMTPEMVKAYRKTGGTPHLDGGYTVFGEVIEGLDVVDKIQKVYTDDYDRPVDDVRILRATVVEQMSVKTSYSRSK